MTKLTICMYGAASDRIDSIYINAAEALGKEIAKRHHKLIYGGGASGLMGACANGVLENGGEVTGVVPTFMMSWKRSPMHLSSHPAALEPSMNSSRYLP